MSCSAAFAVSMAAGCFAGFRTLDSFDLLSTVTCEEAGAWVREHLDPERFALSVIYPKED